MIVPEPTKTSIDKYKNVITITNIAKLSSQANPEKYFIKGDEQLKKSGTCIAFIYDECLTIKRRPHT